MASSWSLISQLQRGSHHELDVFPFLTMMLRGLTIVRGILD